MKKITIFCVNSLIVLSHALYGQNNNQPATAVQFIHNAADDALSQVDIYVNGQLIADNLKFRTATKFLNLPAEIPLKIDVANASSTAASQGFYTVTTTLNPDTAHIIVADGVESTRDFRPGYPFTLFAYNARAAAAMPSNSDIIIHRGFTDAPVINIIEPAIPGEIVTRDVYYRANAADYYEVAAVDHTVKVNDSRGDYIASFIAPLRNLGLQGHSLIMLGSGFVQQLPDRNDPEYGLYIAVRDGGNLIPLPMVPGNIMTFSEANIVMHPNPVREFIRFEFPFAVNTISATIVDNSGMTIRVVEDFGNRIDVSDIEEGIYTINLLIDDRMYADKFVKGL